MLTCPRRATDSDFGDGWHHTIEIEKLLAFDNTSRLSACINGARAMQPEDVGGVGGYERFLDMIADGDHPEHAETIRPPFAPGRRMRWPF